LGNDALILGDLICDALNTIFYKIFSSIDNNISSNLDRILFIDTSITENNAFKQFFGTDATNGLLLIANSLIFGIILFYILKFSFAHLVYSKIDSPYQFTFKCIVFVACMNSSLWLCEKLIYIVSLISDSICELGGITSGYEISFSNLITHINQLVFKNQTEFDFFSFDGILKICYTIGICYIFVSCSVRYILCKISILLSPFAFISVINNQFDGFFKGWFKHFFILLCMQILISMVLVLGFLLEFEADNNLSKFIYLAIIIIIAKCKFYVKEMFSYIYEYSHNKLKEIV